MKFVKFLMVGAIALYSTITLAATPGFYIGAQIGSGKANDGKVGDDALSAIRAIYSSYQISGALQTEKTEGGLSARLYTGYNFNPYFGLEFGYNQIANNKYTSRLTTADGSADAQLKFKTNAFDLVAKGYLPLDTFSDELTDQVNIYVKGGLAYVSHKATLTVNGTDAQLTDNSSNQIRPTLGIGAGYNFNKNLMLDVSYTRIQGKGDLLKNRFSDFSPEINTLALGLNYTFS